MITGWTDVTDDIRLMSNRIMEMDKTDDTPESSRFQRCQKQYLNY